MFNANQVYAIEYVINLTFILTNILYAEFMAAFYQLTTLPESSVSQRLM